MASARLAKLRALLAKNSLAAYLVPTADAHQSEYVAPCDMRRAYLTGFSGSAGTAVVTESKALLWTDGRYFLQAAKQLDPTCWELMKAGNEGVPKIEEWLANNIPSGQRVGFDPFVMSVGEFDRMNGVLAQSKVSLVPVHGNLVDEIWPTAPVVALGASSSSENKSAADDDEEAAAEVRPAPSSNMIIVQTLDYAGKSASDKLKDLRASMIKKKVNVVVVCALDEVAWLFNLRGSDIAYNPVFMSYAIVTLNDATLYVDQAKIDSAVNIHLYSNGIAHKPYDAVLDDLKSLSTEMVQRKTKADAAVSSGKTVDDDDAAHLIWFDPSKSNYAIVNAVDNQVALRAATPITLAKAVKNDAEIKGMIASHVRDGFAVVRFLTWLESQLPSLPSSTASSDEIAKSPLTEYSVTKNLLAFRAEVDDFMGPSFGTISSIGGNGAIIHYSPSKTNSAPLTTGKVFLLDSGGQYRDGTTDITRTVFLARPGAPSQSGDEAKETDAHPSAFQIEAYTRVLQGHIALASAVFPRGTMGPSLDVLARSALWKVGLNYLHGTGHGVGSFLNVHEGPQGIANVARGGTICTTALEKGMVLSNEPGYYHTGEFGIRIENLVHVVEKQAKYAEEKWLGFEDLTVVPLCRQLIDKSLLSNEELTWVNNYHAKCRQLLAPLLEEHDKGAKDWLMKNTEPL